MRRVFLVAAIALIPTLACQISTKDTPMSPNETKPDLMLAMIALNNKYLPPEQEIFDFLKQMWPLTPEVSDVVRENDTVTFTISDNLGSIALIPAPIPWSELEGPCATAWYWPTACEALRGHKAHVIVSLNQASLQPTEQALLLTKLVAAVAATTNSAGIYWGAGTVVHSPEEFLNQSKDVSPESMPLMLWIDFRLQEEADGSFTMFTTGMEAFGLMEIEAVQVNKDPKELSSFVYDVAHYLLENGPIVQDGDTIGGSEIERIEVRYEASMWDSSKKVYRLVFPDVE
jgi:hypothetical protein